MIDELKAIIFKEASYNYVICHNAVRHLIEDSAGTVESDIVDKIILVVLKQYLPEEKNERD